ncbi:2-amino-4-hydroxy-6-hydroxymethyldihydropteridine diphosphokinase [Thiorhodococcus minor]|uniref:2-amino-4-hydroxy-6-hydroxymethyldihydropteridine pyrophosphokinase n=1 Tax=Thiorhodococcus minor TaxID=57489 RepID=A0A6M0JXC0_9GAMM|nr:2-amino-4-hydroxy-6-hydroxymethyldihydropteridine diphosphokinase [Thiorhodococcus minor]NEV60755.1 2-amino-4-hydroxy-6-hydroxymethyldihydropteridine diphosphokinase [Thiorhodococcus minor]
MSEPPTWSYIAIGSNIDAERNVARAITLIADVRETELRRQSSWYTTSPWGIEEQADFVNLVVEVETTLSARSLLEATQAIEARLMRKRAMANGPRTIDLDILLFGDLILDEPDLRIPHPALTHRDFMLLPLVEIAPGTLHPGSDRPLSALTDEIRYRQILSKKPGAPTA